MDDSMMGKGSSMEGQKGGVHEGLKIREETDPYLKPKKCTFHSSSVNYLGVILEKGVTRMDPVKILGIKDWPTPTKVRDVRSFLGFCNFYRAFIRRFAHLALPLNKLTRNDTERHWRREGL